MSWTEERVSTLKALWADGLSASKIAGILGGVTRNAVIGKAHRIDLAGRVSTNRVVKIKAGAVYRKAKTPSPPRKLTQKTIVARWKEDPEIAEILASPPAETAPRIASTLDLEPHHCRWIPGEPGTGYCGDHAVDGLPYCKRHAVRAFAPVSVAQPYLNNPHVSGLANSDAQAIANVSEFTGT